MMPELLLKPGQLLVSSEFTQKVVTLRLTIFPSPFMELS